MNKRAAVVIGSIVAAALIVGAGVFGFITYREKPAEIPAAATAAPSPAEALSEHGLQQHEAKNFDGAIADYTESIKLDPNWLTYFRRARAYDDLQKYDQALPDYTYAVEHNGANTEWVAGALYMRGVVNGKLSKTDAAFADLNKSIELNPKQTPAYRARALLKFLATDPASALPDYNAILESLPNDPDALFNRGIVHYWRRDWKNARSDFDAALKADPKNQEYTLWSLLVRRRNHEAAVPAEYPDLDRAQWPGPISAYLLGSDDALKDTMEKLGAMPEAQRTGTLCQIAFASVAITQAEVPHQELSKHVGAAEKGLSFCAVGRPFEAKIMQQELNSMKTP